MSLYHTGIEVITLRYFLLGILLGERKQERNIEQIYAPLLHIEQVYGKIPGKEFHEIK